MTPDLLTKIMMNADVVVRRQPDGLPYLGFDYSTVTLTEEDVDHLLQLGVNCPPKISESTEPAQEN